LNAGIKFERFSVNFGLDKLDPSLREIAQQTLKIVELIYRPIEPSPEYLAKELRKSHREKRRDVNYVEKSCGESDGGGGDEVKNKRPGASTNPSKRKCQANILPYVRRDSTVLIPLLE
jgi:hypothetical protein